MLESGETTVIEDRGLKQAKINRCTAKAVLTRAGKALMHLINGKRAKEEVSQSLLVYRQAYKNLVLKHDKFTSLIENDDEFAKQEPWLEECQENFMSLESKSKVYMESKNEIEQSNNSVDACTSNASVTTPMDGETNSKYARNWLSNKYYKDVACGPSA